jgi:hypothetical protein
MKDIIELLERYIKEYNLTNEQIQTKVITGKDILAFGMEKNGDYRLRCSNLLEHAVLIAASDSKSGRFLYSSTIFLFSPEDYPYLLFWYNQKELGGLCKLSLNDLTRFVGNRVIEFGFTHSNTNFDYKYTSTKFLISLVKAIEGRIDVFISCTGTESLSEQMLQSSFLPMNNGETDILKPGEINKESRPVAKFAKLLGFELVEGLYSYQTLGPVFFLRRTAG